MRQLVAAVTPSFWTFRGGSPTTITLCVCPTTQRVLAVERGSTIVDVCVAFTGTGSVRQCFDVSHNCLTSSIIFSKATIIRRMVSSRTFFVVGVGREWTSPQIEHRCTSRIRGPVTVVGAHSASHSEHNSIGGGWIRRTGALGGSGTTFAGAAVKEGDISGLPMSPAFFRKKLSHFMHGPTWRMPLVPSMPTAQPARPAGCMRGSNAR